jgi:hypothetical protein
MINIPVYQNLLQIPIVKNSSFSEEYFQSEQQQRVHILDPISIPVGEPDIHIKNITKTLLTMGEDLRTET